MPLLHVCTSAAANLKLLAPSASRTPSTPPRRLFSRSVKCEVTVADKRFATVKNGSDELEICRVLNGMWQTSGGWGRIDRDDAVDAMLRYADAGLSTFDMADHFICLQMAELLMHCSVSEFAVCANQVGVLERRNRSHRVRVGRRGLIRFEAVDDGKVRVEIRNGNDSLDICRVINGMWQTSGGWGKIDRDSAVESMLKYADAGLNTFDMADICK